MPEDGAVVYVQQRAHRAGAQTCLLRLLKCARQADRRPVLLSGEAGWLTAQAAAIGVPVVIVDFPRSRSLPARLWGTRRFARRVRDGLRQRGIRRVQWVHGNDHGEGLLTLALACTLDAGSAVFLRSSSLTRRDFSKYGCDRVGLCAATGDMLWQRCRAWRDDVALVRDGLLAEEFTPARRDADAARGRILVVGTPHPDKGWGDAVAALAAVAGQQPGRIRRVDFVGGARPDSLPLDGLPADTDFLGRRDDLLALARDYELVVLPSRRESVGMAAIELVAAAIPVVATRVGVLPGLLAERCLAEPGAPRSLGAVVAASLDDPAAAMQATAEAAAAMRGRLDFERSVSELWRLYSLRGQR